MACGYYCVRFDCYEGLEALPEKLIGRSFEKKHFTATPKAHHTFFDPAREGIVVRSVLSGPYPTIMIAERHCISEEVSDSDSSSLSSSGSASASVSESASESSSESEPYVCPSMCCYQIVDLNSLSFCCSDGLDLADFGEGNNIFERVGPNLWTGSYNDGLGHGYDITMSSVVGPAEFVNGGIYGENGEIVYTLSIFCYGEYVNLMWAGARENSPVGEWESFEIGCNADYGGITIAECESSDSSSSSFSI